MPKDENIKLKPKDVRQIERFKTLSDDESNAILFFLYELAKIENNIINGKNIIE